MKIFCKKDFRATNNFLDICVLDNKTQGFQRMILFEKKKKKKKKKKRKLDVSVFRPYIIRW